MPYEIELTSAKNKAFETAQSNSHYDSMHKDAYDAPTQASVGPKNPTAAIYALGALGAASGAVIHKLDVTIAQNTAPEGLAKLWQPFSKVTAELAPTTAAYEAALTKGELAAATKDAAKLAHFSAVLDIYPVMDSTAAALKVNPSSEILKKQLGLLQQFDRLPLTKLVEAVGSNGEVIRGAKVFPSESPAGYAIREISRASSAFGKAGEELSMATYEAERLAGKLAWERSLVYESVKSSELKYAANGFARGLIVGGAVVSAGVLADKLLGNESTAVGPSRILVDGVVIPALMLGNHGRMGYAAAAAIFAAGRIIPRLFEKN